MLIQKSTIVAVLVMAGLSSVKAVQITGFGSGEFTVNPFSDLSYSQTANNLQITGSDFAGNTLIGSFSSVSLPSSLTQLELTATKTGTTSSLFSIELFDALSGGKALEYQGSWASFPNGSPATIILTQTFADPLWNGNAVNLVLTTGGPGDPINVQLDNLAAVPEPTTIALLGTALAGGVVMLRRRRASSLS